MKGFAAVLLAALLAAAVFGFGSCSVSVFDEAGSAAAADGEASGDGAGDNGLPPVAEGEIAAEEGGRAALTLHPFGNASGPALSVTGAEADAVKGGGATGLVNYIQLVVMEDSAGGDGSIADFDDAYSGGSVSVSVYVGRKYHILYLWGHKNSPSDMEPTLLVSAYGWVDVRTGNNPVTMPLVPLVIDATFYRAGEAEPPLDWTRGEPVRVTFGTAYRAELKLGAKQSGGAAVGDGLWPLKLADPLTRRSGLYAANSDGGPGAFNRGMSAGGYSGGDAASAEVNSGMAEAKVGLAGHGGHYRTDADHPLADGKLVGGKTGGEAEYAFTPEAAGVFYFNMKYRPFSVSADVWNAATNNAPVWVVRNGADDAAQDGNTDFSANFSTTPGKNYHGGIGVGATLYTIDYDGNGQSVGTAPASRTVNVNTELNLPEGGSLAKTGWLFGGWTEGSAGALRAAGAPYTVTGDVAFFAKWAPYAYTVTFNANGGTANPANGTVESPATTLGTLPSAPVKADAPPVKYAFAGWNTDPGGNGLPFNQHSAVAGNIIVYAQWQAGDMNDIAVSFDPQGGVVSPIVQTVKAGLSLSGMSPAKNLPATPLRPGCTFGGWYPNSAGTGDAFTAGTVVNAAMTVYAKWTAIPYTIAFTNNGSTLQTGSLNYGALPVYTGAAPTKASTAALTYAFSGWDPEIALVTEPKIYAAQFASSTRQYLVTFKDGDGNVVQSGLWNYNTTPSYTGAAPAKTATPALAYTWNNTTPWSPAIAAATADATYTAQFTDATRQYTVTFNPDGGALTGGSLTSTVNYNSAVGTLPAAAKAGYAFGNWWTVAGSSGGAQFLATTPVTANITVYARWGDYGRVVTFNLNGGNIGGVATNVTRNVVSPYTTVGAAAGMPANPVKTSTATKQYTFAGWTDGFNKDTPVTANITVTAQWTESNLGDVAVTFNPYYGTVTPSVRMVTPGSTVPTASVPAPSRTGYSFVKWYDAETGGSEVNWGTAITAAKTVYARWAANTYTVTYTGGSGSTGSTGQSGHSYDTAKALSANGFSKTGYTFAGWDTATAGANVVYGPGASVVNLTATSGGTVQLYAVWAINTYTLTFNSAGGSTVASQTVNYGATVAKPGNPSKTGYGFVNWYDAASGGNAITWALAITADRTVHAQWTPDSYAITYKDGGNGAFTGATAGLPATHTYGTQTTLVNTSRSGYRFDGWYTDSAATATRVYTLGAASYTAALTLYAKWTADVTVSYVANNGTGTAPTAQTVQAGNTVTLQGNTFSRAGYTFAGWTAGSTGGALYAAGASYPAAASIIFYASWTILQYTVSFDSKEGSLVASQTVNYNTAATEPSPAPTKTGYLFGGWVTADGGSTAVTWATLITANKTVYAKWNSYSYTVTFDKNGGSTEASPASKAVVSPNTTLFSLGLPTAPTKANAPPKKYTFAGWKDTAGVVFNENTVVTAAMTVKAQWAESDLTEVSVNFDPQGGVVDPVVKTVPPGTSLSSASKTLPTPTRTGYDFGYWWTGTGGTGDRFYDTTAVGALGITVYAKWTAQQYAITYRDAGNGAFTGVTTGLPTSHTYDTATTLVNTSRSGYRFDGWYTDQAATANRVTSLGEAAYTAALTLYAKWTQEFTVTYSANGGGTAPGDQTAYAGEPVTLAGAMTRLGYRFDGWTAGSTGGILYAAGASYPVAANITFWAKWTQQVTVTYNGNGTTTNVPTSQTAYVGDSVTLREPGTMALTGSNFAGWTAGGTSGIFYSANASYPVSGAIIFYAKWTEKINVAAPSINTIPNAYVGINEPVTSSLSVSSSQADGVTTTYQWYSNPTASGYSGSLLPGETGPTLSGIVTAGVGTKYFYVKVTNTIADNGDGGTKSASATSNVATIQVRTLKERIDAVTSGNATITLYADEDFAASPMSTISDKTITLIGSGAHTVQLTGTVGQTTMLSVYNGGTLTLGNGVTLQGTINNNLPMVWIDGGSFYMNAGSAITGNRATSYGGGVGVNNGSFTMNGGTISNNTAAYGAGVYVGTGGIFIMNDGIISNNDTQFYGGGVDIYSKFTMNGGTISGNTAGDRGGGVYTNSAATFIKTGGTICGSNSLPSAIRNVAPTGQAVYYARSSNTQTRTAELGPSDNITTNTIGSGSNWD